MLLFWVALTGIGNFQNGPHEQPSSLSTLPWFKNAAAASGNQFLKKAFVTIVSEDLLYIYIYTYCMYFWLFSYPVFLVDCIPQQDITTITTETNEHQSFNESKATQLRSYPAPGAYRRLRRINARQTHGCSSAVAIEGYWYQHTPEINSWSSTKTAKKHLEMIAAIPFISALGALPKLTSWTWHSYPSIPSPNSVHGGHETNAEWSADCLPHLGNREL